MPSNLKSNHVFINCPFDSSYRPIFNAIVFAVYDLGFIARCALEEDDAADFRLSKIERIIEECKFGIHDLSAVTLDVRTNLPALICLWSWDYSWGSWDYSWAAKGLDPKPRSVRDASF